MSGITVKNAAAQSKIILLLAVVWLIMAGVTGRHRKATIVIYAGIGAIFEVLGLYSCWVAIQAFSQIRIQIRMMDCSMVVLLVLLFLILAAVIVLRTQPDKERDNGSENSGQDSSGGFG